MRVSKGLCKCLCDDRLVGLSGTYACTGFWLPSKGTQLGMPIGREEASQTLKASGSQQLSLSTFHQQILGLEAGFLSLGSLDILQSSNGSRILHF